MSENPVFADRCVSAGLNFIGPKVEIIELFGDKARARLAAVGADVPVTRGIARGVSLGEATDFFDSLGLSYIKYAANFITLIFDSDVKDE